MLKGCMALIHAQALNIGPVQTARFWLGMLVRGVIVSKVTNLAFGTLRLIDQGTQRESPPMEITMDQPSTQR